MKLNPESLFDFKVMEFDDAIPEFHKIYWSIIWSSHQETINNLWLETLTLNCHAKNEVKDQAIQGIFV